MTAPGYRPQFPISWWVKPSPFTTRIPATIPYLIVGEDTAAPSLTTTVIPAAIPHLVVGH